MNAKIFVISVTIPLFIRKVDYAICLIYCKLKGAQIECKIYHIFSYKTLFNLFDYSFILLKFGCPQHFTLSNRVFRTNPK
jgi:hypothetical protein